MTRAIEDAHREVGDVLALGLGEPSEIGPDGGGDVDDVGALGPDDELLHVEDGAGVVHRTPLRHRQHGDGVRHPLGVEGGAVNRVDGDIDVGSGSVTHALAVEEHGGVILLALADDDGAVHRHAADELAHGVDGGAVGAVLVSSADPASGSHGGRLGHAHQLQGQIAIRNLGYSLLCRHATSVAMGNGRVARSIRGPF